jgi:hypothetical protein
MRSAINQTPPSEHRALANPIPTAPRQTTNTMRTVSNSSLNGVITMKQAILGFCIFAAACSPQPVSPTAPSSGAGVIGTPTQPKVGAEVVGTQRQANGGAANVEVTFTKWITTFPTLAGVTGGDVPGAFAGTVLSFIDNGTVAEVKARYEVLGTDAGHSFVALVEGTQNNQTQQAVLNGTVVEGWLVGARVHATFDVINPCPEFGKSVCFTGVIRVMSGSSN